MNIRQKLQNLFFSFAAMGLLACGEGNQASVIPSQHWQEMDVRIETHPNPPVAGMLEVVVIVTGPRGRPIHDLIISMRGGDALPWVQTIQDGHMGVYRRAVDVGGGDAAALQVRLQRGDEQKILLFPFKLVAG